MIELLTFTGTSAHSLTCQLLLYGPQTLGKGRCRLILAGFRRDENHALLETQETPAATVTASETSQVTQTCNRVLEMEDPVSAVDIETSPGDQKRKIRRWVSWTRMQASL